MSENIKPSSDLSLGQKIDLCVATLPAQFRYVPDPTTGGDPMDGLLMGIRELCVSFSETQSALRFERQMIQQHKADAEHYGKLFDQAKEIEAYAEELLRAARDVAPYLTAKDRVDYVADGEAWNRRAVFLQALDAAAERRIPEIGIPQPDGSESEPDGCTDEMRRVAEEIRAAHPVHAVVHPQLMAIAARSTDKPHEMTFIFDRAWEPEEMAALWRRINAENSQVSKSDDPVSAAAWAVVRGWQDNMTVIEDYTPLIKSLHMALIADVAWNPPREVSRG